LKNKAKRLQINQSSGTLEALAGGKKILSPRGRRTIQVVRERRYILKIQAIIKSRQTGWRYCK
jgi:hypothetical protein